MIDLKKLDAIQKVSQRVAILSLVVFFALIAFSIYQLYSINRKIAQKADELLKKEAEIKDRESKIAALDQKIAELGQQYKTLDDLYGKTVAADPESAKRAAVTEIEANPKTAQATIAVIEANPMTARLLPPRVYIQIQDDSQRARAKEIAAKLKAGGFIAPGIENVGKNAPDKTELRFFNAGDESSNDINNIASILSGEGIRVKKTLIPGHETSNKIRARHYELWFGADFPPPVRLPGVGKIDQPLRVKPVQ
jgi:hypothetical protein